MPVHAVLRTDREALDVPATYQRFPRLRLREAAVRAKGLDVPAELRGGGDVRAHQTARHQRPRESGQRGINRESRMAIFPVVRRCAFVPGEPTYVRAGAELCNFVIFFSQQAGQRG